MKCSFCGDEEVQYNDYGMIVCPDCYENNEHGCKTFLKMMWRMDME